jgi:molybdopterin synthase sulfur carrier subunit
MPAINICYFALLREKAGVEEETFHTQTQTYGELFDELSAKYQFALPSSMIQVAVNDEFSSMSALLQEGAKVVFIPPVAGG